MTVGAPAAEAKFREAITAAQKGNQNVVSYPVIYVSRLACPVLSFVGDSCTIVQAFHGSPLKNWHSVRHK